MDVIARKRPMPEDPARAPAPDESDAAPSAVPDDTAPRAVAPRTEPLDLAQDLAPPPAAAAPFAAPPARWRDSEAPQIWDLDPPPPTMEAVPHKPEPPAEPMRRRRIPSAGPEAQAQAPAPAGVPAGSVASRARTRVLGFAAAEVAHDVFAGDRVAPGAVARFPAGWIVVLEGPGRGASFTLGAGVSTIGRAPDQTVALDFGDMAISREMHASIAYDEEQNRFFVGHGGKSNIVRRNGAPVLATEELFHGDVLRIGRTALRFIALCGPDFTWGTRDEDEA